MTQAQNLNLVSLCPYGAPDGTKWRVQGITSGFTLFVDRDGKWRTADSAVPLSSIEFESSDAAVAAFEKAGVPRWPDDSIGELVSDGGPAFPGASIAIFPPSTGSVARRSPGDIGIHKGMSLRDYFAAAALTGLIADEDYSINAALDGKDPVRTLSKIAYRYADQMLEVRK